MPMQLSDQESLPRLDYSIDSRILATAIDAQRREVRFAGWSLG